MLRTAPSALLQVGHPPRTYDISHKCLRGSSDSFGISPKRVLTRSTFLTFKRIQGQIEAKVYQIPRVLSLFLSPSSGFCFKKSSQAERMCLEKGEMHTDESVTDVQSKDLKRF